MHHLKAAREFDFDPILQLRSALPSFLEPSSSLHEGRRLEGVGEAYLMLPEVEADVRLDRINDGVRMTRNLKTPAGPLRDVLEYFPGGKTYGIEPFPRFAERLVKGPEDLEKLKYLLPDPNRINIDDYHEVCHLAGDNGLVEVAINSVLDFRVADVYGVEEMFMSYYDNPDFLHDICEMFHRHMMEETKAHLEQGVKMIFGTWFFTSIGAGWSPEIYQEIFLPYVKEHVDLTHQYDAIYHFYDVANIMPILEGIASTGVDMIETLTPPPMGDVDLEEVKKLVGNQVCLKGNIDVVNVLMLGNPKLVREKVREAIQTAGPGGGFILGTSDSMRPEKIDGTPIENVREYFKAAREEGNIYG